MEQLEPFDYTDFNLVEDYWVRYEGKQSVIQANLSTTISTALDDYCWQMDNTLRVTSRRIASMGKALFTISLVTPRLGSGTIICLSDNFDLCYIVNDRKSMQRKQDSFLDGEPPEHFVELLGFGFGALILDGDFLVHLRNV